ncbi:hypothetical protein P9274_01065 [Schinkia azotoformans]|uniref:hypothetical protein n=1 Tax=Schinkia azotoformans TaxID=1454 RepID=UPI002E239EB2|nr:hypothetical protein [Schinkia azotoformans]
MTKKTSYTSPNGKYRVVVFLLDGDIIPSVHVYVNGSKSFLPHRTLNKLPQYIQTEIDRMKYLIKNY